MAKCKHLGLMKPRPTEEKPAYNFPESDLDPLPYGAFSIKIINKSLKTT